MKQQSVQTVGIFISVYCSSRELPKNQRQGKNINGKYQDMLKHIDQ
jgi:hypothetical protein